ncbi:MAG: hypothetical protein ABI591_23660 [Kofleriaceae bacterium]
MNRAPRAVASFAGKRSFNAERRRGFVLSCIGLAAVGAWTLLVQLVRPHVVDRRWQDILFAPMAVGALVALVGLAKVLLGRTLRELADEWSSMSGARRLLVGSLVVALAAGAIVIVFGTIATVLL